MKRGMMITCEDASHLVIRKDSENLKTMDRIRLFIHLALCRFCKLFEKQNKIINSGFENIDEIQHSHLTEESKIRILRKIQHYLNE